MFPHDLLKLGHELGFRIIHISTDGVFSKSAGLCLEDSEIFSKGIYGKSKKMGEGMSKQLLNIRCSIIGPSPYNSSGLFEWFLKRPKGAEISGYIDHIWNGVTSLQLSTLCYKIIADDYFSLIRNESDTHHFCPNNPISKYDLLQILKKLLRSDIKVLPLNCPDGPSVRVLETRYRLIRELFGKREQISEALSRLIKN